MVALNAAAHFVPFERASLSPDDYATLWAAQSIDVSQIGRTAQLYPSRPLYSVLAVLQAKAFSDGAAGPLLLLFCMSTAQLLCVRSLLLQILRVPGAALVGAVFFALLPNKLETYHGSLFVVRTLASVLFLLSVLLFLRFAESGSARSWWGSWLAYAAGVFCEETGFFTPALLGAYCLLFDRRRLRAVAPFALPAAAYAIHRLSFVEGVEAAPASGLSLWRPLTALLHQYAGAYMAMPILNGLDRFLAIEPWWLAFAVSADLLLLWVLWRAVPRALAPIDRRVLTLAVVTFVVFLLPLFLQEQGGIAGRHLVLPSVGVVLLLLGGLSRLAGRVRITCGVVAAIGLIVSQGNGWAQVVACRINASVYAALKERQHELRRSARVVIDVGSFARSVPAWVPPLRRRGAEFSFLNSYYGAQALEEWSLLAMVRLAAGSAIPLTLAVEPPASPQPGALRIVEGRNIGSRARFQRVQTTLPAAGTLLIAFADVYPDGFQDGKRH